MANSNINMIIGQLNFTVGDIQSNTDKIIKAIKEANNNYKADIIVFPELSISSYPPEDLLLRPAFNESINIALNKIKISTENIYVILGYPLRKEGKLYNACSLIHNREIKKKSNILILCM